MEAVWHSFLAGVPVLLMHFLVTIVMLVVGITIYIWVTPHKDLKLVRDGNIAAGISLFGAILGIALPLSVSMSVSINISDIVVWGLLTVMIQLIAFRLVDALLQDLSARIEAGEISASLVLFGFKISVAIITSAAVSG